MTFDLKGQPHRLHRTASNNNCSGFQDHVSKVNSWVQEQKLDAAFTEQLCSEKHRKQMIQRMPVGFLQHFITTISILGNIWLYCRIVLYTHSSTQYHNTDLALWWQFAHLYQHSLVLQGSSLCWSWEMTKTWSAAPGMALCLSAAALSWSLYIWTNTSLGWH